MQEPPHSVVKGFELQIRAMCSEFRVVWGERNYGICRWVVERRLPPDIHRRALDDFAAAFPGEDRFIDQQMTDESGNNVGLRHIDLVPEYHYVHAVENNSHDIDSPLGYRPPDSRDVAILHRYLHEFRNMAEQMRAVREEQQAADEANRKERNAALADDIKHSKSLWEMPENLDLGKVEAMIGTEL